MRHILLCTDFSENSERALNYAIFATTEYDAELTLLHVLEEKVAKTDQAMAAATQQLEQLIPEEVRKTVAVFGSTTYRVIQLGPCPVLAVHI